MRKQILVLALVVLLVGVVAAGRVISNLDEIYIEDFVAGSLVRANFSYDYIGGLEDNVGDSPAVLNLTIESGDGDYPVWKGDFEIDGFVRRYWWGGFVREIPFNCSEESSQVISYSIGSATVHPGNGTFFCYNEDGNLELDRRDEVFLNINSNPALWPGKYNLTAEFLYLTEDYINVDVVAVNDSARVTVGTNAVVVLNMSFNISGGNAIKMRMSDLVDGYAGGNEVWFSIVNGTNYTTDKLDARLVYNNTEYPVRETYWVGDPIVFGDADDDGIVRDWALFKMNITKDMLPGNYHGEYQFNVTQVGA